VELAASATAVGFAAAALLQIERARGHGLVAQEMFENAARGVVGTPELLAELGEVAGHLHVKYCIACRLASEKTQKSEKPRKRGTRVAPPSKSPCLARVLRPLPHCLNCSTAGSRLVGSGAPHRTRQPETPRKEVGQRSAFQESTAANRSRSFKNLSQIFCDWSFLRLASRTVTRCGRETEKAILGWRNVPGTDERGRTAKLSPRRGPSWHATAINPATATPSAGASHDRPPVLNAVVMDWNNRTHAGGIGAEPRVTQKAPNEHGGLLGRASSHTSAYLS